MIKKVVLFVTVFSALVATGWGVTNRQFLRDWYVVKTTTQQAASTAVGDKIGLTGEGRFIYKASQPQIQASKDFNTNCGNIAKEQSIVLGCYSKQKIYVFDVTDTRLTGAEEVTAAHELLHAVYERLSPQERTDLNSQLRQVSDTITDARFQETLRAYRQSEPGQVDNEIHSILGTEIEVLPQALEDYYAQFFDNRSTVVAFAKQYQSQFDEIERQIAKYDAQLVDLKAQIEAVDATLQKKETALNAKQAELERLRREDVRSYNTQVPVFNSLVQQYNVSVNQVKQLTNDYNSLVSQRNELAATQNDLTQKLDSNFQTR